MTDSLLLSRIASLDENLARVDQSLERLKVWQSDLERQNQDEVPVAEDLWRHLNRQVRRQFKNQRKALKQLSERLEAGDAPAADADAEPGEAGEPPASVQAWRDYAELRDESERLFEECLEFIGGLAFRRTGLDRERMCEIADALILACAREAYAEPWYFLTVPSLREVVTKSRMRLSRIRFPEWTLWTLPVTAYVLGHEIMDEQDVAPFISGQMAAWARQDVADHHVHVLIADIFGAYVMGPAYGHAGIRLRFDASRAYVETPDRPAESSRAEVVLATLEHMDAHARDLAWQAQVKALREEWTTALAAARPEGTAPDAVAALKELVEEALEHFEEKLNMTAQYSESAWVEAAKLYGSWREEATNSNSSAALSVMSGKLLTARDVLNAAWLLRLERPQDTDRIERAAADTCRELLVPQRRPRGPGQAPIPID
jgi:hypothetical protein